jgi:two-component system NtrC family sensor kinase
MHVRITRFLAFRLFIIVLLVMLVSAAILATMMLNWHSEKYLSITKEWALRTSDLIKRSMHYSMMENRREDIYQTISTLGTEPGIEAIRIYNKKGEITFSTVVGESGKYVNTNAEACNVCHQPGKPLPIEGDSANGLTRIFYSQKGYRVLGVITPIKNEPGCYNASCHEHSSNQTVLGVLDVMLPLKNLDQNLFQLRNFTYVAAALMVAGVTVISGIFIWVMVNVPVRKLIRGTHEVMKGNLEYRIDVHSADEIGELAASFNKMTEELSRARDELTRWAQTLEEKVEQKTDELRRALSNMVQVEKMASLGKLAASVAHELNNPLAGILAYAKLLRKKASKFFGSLSREKLSEDELKEFDDELRMIADESARCGNIVSNLLLFSRQKVGEFRPHNLVEIVEQSVKLIAHHLEMHGVKCDIKAPGSPVEITCDPQQIEQAMIALEINAIEAMPDGGNLKIEIKCVENKDLVKVIISDTGTGIAPEDLEHIFEPFFTTKKDGKGTGLGLAVVHGIVERHNGKIDVESKVNLGTTFTITLPMHSVC